MLDGLKRFLGIPQISSEKKDAAATGDESAKGVSKINTRLKEVRRALDFATAMRFVECEQRKRMQSGY